MEEIAKTLRSGTDEVLRRWENLADTRPWIALPDSERRDSLPAVIQGLADAALTLPASAPLVREVVRCGLEHGRDRRQQGMKVEHLFSEYYALRSAIWSYLQERTFPIGETSRAMLRIDAAISTATGASLIGYHEPELPEGQITAHGERLVAESVLLG